MKFIVRNQAQIANKYVRFAKWKIRKLSRKFVEILYSEIYVKKISHSPKCYDVTVKLGPGPDIILSSQSNDLGDLWSSLSTKMKRQMRKFNQKRNRASFILIAFVFFFASCNNENEINREINMEQFSPDEIIHYSGLSEKEQQDLSPLEAINSLRKGNSSFINNKITARDHSKEERLNAVNQYPVATILSCFDSRIPIEDIFNKGIGDLLVLRVAGNVINPDILGSMEYGADDLGSKVIVVLGHTNCTSISKAINEDKDGYLSSLTYKIKPSVDKASSVFGPKTTANLQYENKVIELNIQNSINEILDKSPKLNNMKESGEIEILGAVYDMSTGEVKFI